MAIIFFACSIKEKGWPDFLLEKFKHNKQTNGTHQYCNSFFRNVRTGFSRTFFESA
jgi:hypothetical protein